MHNMISLAIDQQLALGIYIYFFCLFVFFLACKWQYQTHRYMLGS